MVLLDRARRLLWARPCGRKARQRCQQARERLGEVMQHTSARTLLTDGARRSGSLLCAIGSAVLRTGPRGRPQKPLRHGGKVRRKHQGAPRPKRGRKRPKEPTPSPEHPDTAQPLATAEMHAHQLEAFPTARRRRCAAERRRTHPSAKNQTRRQERVDVYGMVPHCVRVHCTTRPVPAVA
jgi:hypothetical protein